MAEDTARMAQQTKLGWTFAITAIALFMAALDNLVVVTALPVIQQDLNASLSSLEWTVNAYTLTFAVLLLTGAALGDRFGRRRMLAVGLFIFTASSAAAALSTSAGMLIAARAAQGVGGAIVTPLTLTILSAGVPPARRGAFIGAWSGIAGLAVAFGPLVGGAVVTTRLSSVAMKTAAEVMANVQIVRVLALMCSSFASLRRWCAPRRRPRVRLSGVSQCG